MGQTQYRYDPSGNRTCLVEGDRYTGYAYDRGDRITGAGSASVTLNANGNTVTRGTDSFAYDQANRLTSATVGGVTTTYAYDGDGKRASQTTGGVTTTSVYDVNAGLPVLLDDGTSQYVWHRRRA